MEEGRFSLVDCWMRRFPTKFFRKSGTPKPSWRFGPSYIKVLFEGKSRNMMVDLGRKFQTIRCREDDDVHGMHDSGSPCLTPLMNIFGSPNFSSITHKHQENPKFLIITYS